MAKSKDSKAPSRLSAPVVSKGSDEKSLKKELEWLKDPAKFADHVHYTLRSQQIEKALNLCRIASKSMSCIVAWNHVIDWHVKNEKVNAAIDIYNEMKKRGQFPDSYTYMLLFRAVPIQKAHDKKEYHSQMANKAVAIYNSMSSPTSRVKPSIMHTNAVLRLCSLSRNMDLLWSVASQIPESGPASADHITYSILLSAIRFGAMGPGTGEMVYVDQIAENRNQAVNEGRRIWQEVIPRWRAGEVMVDAQLVRAMAKLLSISKRMEDWDDILNLAQQTTNIQRLIPPLGSPDRKTDHVPLPKDPEEDVEKQTSNAEDTEGWVPTPASNAFRPVQIPANDQAHPNRRRSLVYVQPENGVLNVLLEACTNMRIPKTAHAYWDLLTKEYNVSPDLDNYECMLRLLRINRSSRRVVQVMTEMKDEGLKATPRTYRIAMGACARDKNNANIVDNMTVIVDEMMKAMQSPDIATLDEYLDIAFITEDPPHIAKALDRMHLVVYQFQKQLNAEAGAADQGYKDRILRFYKHLSGCVDSFAKREDVPEEDVEKWMARRSEYDSLVGMYRKKQFAGQRGHAEGKKVSTERSFTPRRTSGVSRGNGPAKAGIKVKSNRGVWKQHEQQRELKMSVKRVRRV